MLKETGTTGNQPAFALWWKYTNRENDMDRQQATAPEEALLNAPVIQRAPQIAPETTEETFVPAPQSRLLNGIIGAAWLFHLFTPAIAGDGPTEQVSSIVYGFAYSISVVTLFGMLGVIGLAFKNSAKTAPISIGLGLATMIPGALCGLVGHPASTWLSSLAFGAVVAAGSAAVFARRA